MKEFSVAWEFTRGKSLAVISRSYTNLMLFIVLVVGRYLRLERVAGYYETRAILLLYSYWSMIYISVVC